MSSIVGALLMNREDYVLASLRKNESLNSRNEYTGKPPLVTVAYAHRLNAQLTILENIRVLRLLVAYGMDINLASERSAKKAGQGVDKETVMHVVAEEGYLRAFKALLSCGGKVSIRDANGNTPMDRVPSEKKAEFQSALNAHYLEQARRLNEAALLGNYVLVQTLLEKEETDMRVSYQGETALMAAASRNTEGHVCCIQQLLASATHREIDNYLNQQQEKTGQTALHKAAEKGNRKTYDCLRQLNADTSLTDNSGKTPVNLMDEAQERQARESPTDVTADSKFPWLQNPFTFFSFWSRARRVEPNNNSHQPLLLGK